MHTYIYEALDAIAAGLSKNRLLVFLIAAIAYMELVYRLWSFRSLNADYLFPALFSIPAGALLFIAAGLFPEGAGRIITVLLMTLLSVVYGVQLVYYGIFRMPLSLTSLQGAGDVMQFGDIIAGAIWKNSFAILLLLGPPAILVASGDKFAFGRLKPANLLYGAAFLIAAHVFAIVCVNLTGNGAVSQRTLYYGAFSPALSAGRLGLLTTMRLDVSKLLFSAEAGTDTVADAAGNAAAVPAGAAGTEPETEKAPVSAGKTQGAAATDGPAVFEEKDQILDIDFAALAADETNPALKDMHGYFSRVEPTKTNQYTGIFKGCNLVMFTAESFSPYAVSPGLTPTLHKMATQGFVFTDFYTPVWGVSTSDGEYVACTGLIPKSGVWSFARSGKNFLPFAMGNQLKRLGYPVKAYHDHTYTFYKRNVSHPNMGYEYKGVGNGLEIAKTWPESDLEMIEATAGDFADGPFHNYYMTVSGHMNYNFSGNYIANKNRARVEALSLSSTSKAYIACNLELEDAMRTLLDRLEAVGAAENTVIALSADHYPYGLPKECIDELAGRRVEQNFELYKSTFILWKAGMEPVVVDKPCSSLDINPTLSNLFGLEYDSRLLMGRDILSDSPPLVVFSNRSWITGRARFNAAANKTAFTDGTGKDDAYVGEINKIVADKFKYSAKILDYDYYKKVIKR